MMNHGAVRLFGEDYSSFIDKMTFMFANTVLPEFLVLIYSHLISPIELIIGFTLILGLKTRHSLLILQFNMLILVSRVCLLQKWELAGLQMGYVLIIYLLGQNIDKNKFSIDSFLAHK